MLLIDRKMPKSCDDCVCNSDQYWCNLLNDEIDYEKTRMGRMPNCTLKEDERKTGKWLPYLSEGLTVKCSECGSRFDRPWHHCPNCGASMTEGESS